MLYTSEIQNTNFCERERERERESWMETMSEEGFEEWDADFLDQLIHVEELALTSTKQHQPLRTTSSSSSQTHHYINNPTNTNTMMSYSPPRQLSQRVSFDDKQLEIDMLKVCNSSYFYNLIDTLLFTLL